MAAVPYQRFTTLVPNATSKQLDSLCSESIRGLQPGATRHGSNEICFPGTDANCTDLSSHRASCYQSHLRKKLGIYKHHEVALLLILLTKINNIMIGESLIHLFSRSTYGFTSLRCNRDSPQASPIRLSDKQLSLLEQIARCSLNFQNRHGYCCN